MCPVSSPLYCSLKLIKSDLSRSTGLPICSNELQSQPITFMHTAGLHPDIVKYALSGGKNSGMLNLQVQAFEHFLKSSCCQLADLSSAAEFLNMFI